MNLKMRGKASPFPTYDNRLCFANIEIHTSKTHRNILVNLSGTACRQYEEYMSKADGWHWHAFINQIILMKGKPARLDLALDIFDDSSPSGKNYSIIQNGDNYLQNLKASRK